MKLSIDQKFWIGVAVGVVVLLGILWVSLQSPSYWHEVPAINRKFK